MPTYDDNFFDDGRKYFAHGLPAWKKFVIENLGAKSIADFCCGQGDWLEPLQDLIPIWGCDLYSDSSLRIKEENFRSVDICNTSPKDLDVGERDVVMSLEALEHVENKFENNFLDCLLSPNPRLVVLGVASGRGHYDPTQFKLNKKGEKVLGGPDWKIQFGRHHVNCQPTSEVIKKMSQRGYEVDEGLSSIFSNLRVPGRTSKGKFAFASFYRNNTRIYRKI